MAKKPKEPKRWQWEILVRVSRQGELIMEYDSTLKVQKAYSEADLENWMDQIRRRALRSLKKEVPKVDLRRCKIVVTSELKDTHAEKP